MLQRQGRDLDDAFAQKSMNQKIRDLSIITNNKKKQKKMSIKNLSSDINHFNNRWWSFKQKLPISCLVFYSFLVFGNTEKS